MFKVPNTTDEWLQISQDFDELWQLENVLGALDGKHIRVNAPAHSGSDYYNFKGFHSIVLFAMVDARYRFRFIDVGCNGRANDSTIYKNGFLYNGLKTKSIGIPESKFLKGKKTRMPFYFIGDDAFALDQHLMKPYNRNIKLTTAQYAFNYRISRARMVVECAFGMLANRFRIFHRPIEVLPETVDQIIMTSCVLHNFLIDEQMINNPSQKINVDEIIELPRTMSSLGPQLMESYRFASKMRDNLAKHCVSEGDVEFQWHKINMLKPKPV